MRKRKSPNPDPTFTHYWNILLPEVEARENFKPGHLAQLEVLCNLYKDYHRLTEFIEKNGMTFESNGRNGYQVHPRPEVAQLNRVISEIRAYSKMLGLLLHKDNDITAHKDEEDEWK